MVKLLAVSDEEDRGLTLARLQQMSPNLIISCGDLGPDYLDFVSSAANAPLLYVPGNHDPDQRPRRGDRDYTSAPRDDEMITNEPPRPGGINLDGRMYSEQGLRFAGFGGSVRYRRGPNQHTQRQMKRRVNSMLRKERFRGLGRVEPIDVLVTHSPPLGVGDGEDDPHKGFEAFHKLIEVLQPEVMLHGHIHPHGFPKPDRHIGKTKIINVIPHKLVEVR